MLVLYEHYHYGENKGRLSLDECQGLIEQEYIRFPKSDREALPYFYLKQRYDGDYDCQTNYYIGLDWLEVSKKSIYVEPKMNNQNVMIDHLSMLFEALEEPENINHLEGLCEVDFDRPMIKIEQKHNDDLTIFLIVEFLQILKHIVKIGLKKQYYFEKNTLKGRIKGKLNISESITNSFNKQTIIDNVCSYQMFGVDHDENRLLKKAYNIAARFLESYTFQQKGLAELKNIVSYIRPVFREVGDELDVNKIKAFKPNPFYKKHEQGIKLAQLILKRLAYNTAFQNDQLVTVPPYWIDMSKLFELYVFKKLREIYPETGAVTYHIRTHRQELDFILNTENEYGEKVQLIIDAKYKPRYINRGIGMDDARQLSGYTRLANMYKRFDIQPQYGCYPVIDALIIYPDQLQDSIDRSSENIVPCKYLQLKKIGILGIDHNYVQFYKLGIQLPEIVKIV